MIETKRSPMFLDGCLTKQVQRILPACIACLLIIFFASTTSFGDTFNDALPNTISKAHDFPKKIWQTWKVDTLSLDQREIDRVHSWTIKNPSHRYELLTDGNDLQYVADRYGPSGFNRPDIVSMYRSINATIVKADLLRYLVMYAEGGIYADIDVEALRPASRFIPDRYDGRDVDMVIGVEIDQPEYSDHKVLGQKCKSFCQWTFMCKPGLPVMLKLVEHIISWLTDLAQRQKVPISEVKLDFDDIIAGTGPSAFTGAILEDISERVGHKVDWNTFHNLAESKLVAGVLVLTVEAFAAGQGHSDSGTHDARTALVKHHYHASGWPSTHPRYKHPLFGEVEHCNWNADCVRKWDEDIAEFERLPPEEKAIKIAVQKEKDEAAFRLMVEGQNQAQVQVPPAFPPAFPPELPPAFPPAQPAL